MTTREVEAAIVLNFNGLPEERRRLLIKNFNFEGAEMIAIEKDQSLRFYLLVPTLEALIALRQLYDHGELKPVIESLLNKLATDTPQFPPVCLQHLYLIDYCKAEQYFHQKLRMITQPYLIFSQPVNVQDIYTNTVVICRQKGLGTPVDGG